MEIGIITFHRAINYGAVLQAYALEKFIKNGLCCKNVEIIDYQKQAQKKAYKLFRPNNSLLSIVQNLYTLLNINSLNAKYRKYRSFVEKYIDLSANSYDDTNTELLSQDSTRYSYLISGSDQIWNVRMSDFDESYFLAFNNNAKKIAYAPSLGRLDFTPLEEEYFIRYLKTYNILSVREYQSSEYLKKFYSKEIPVLMDPVFLLSAKEWNEISIKPNVSEKYILFYSLGNVAGIRKFVKKLSRETGFKVVTILKSLRDVFSGFEKRFDAGPQDFLGLISNAEYVVTDSFHAVSFSLIYHRKFWAFSHTESAGERGSWTRIPNLLNIAGLQNRILNASNCDSVNIYESIDFKKVDSNLVPHIEKSKSFLKKALDIVK